MTPRRLRIWSLVVLLAVGLLCSAVWFLGPRLGLESLPVRLTVILGVAFLGLAFLLVQAVRTLRAASPTPPLPVPAPPPAPPSPAARVRAHLRQALRALERSHLGRTRGRAARYRLPWFLVMGLPGSGASQAVRHSGLTFSLAGPDPADSEFCTWRFATEGVLLDMPGRYLAGPEHPAEWQEFLRQVKAHRPGAPLEGLILTVALPDLLEGAATSGAKARQLRSHIGMVEHLAGSRLPVYLLFTKLDLLPGFPAFFAGLDEEARRQAWGAAFDPHQGPDFQPATEAARHLALLQQGLTAHGRDRLAQHPDHPHRAALTTFPLAFRPVGEAVQAFIEQLAGPDPYHARPCLRGFYFCSALQDGAPLAGLPGQPLEAFQLGPAAPEEPVPSRPYFLEQVFRRVVFTDRYLAGHLGPPRRDRRAWAWLGASMAAMGMVAAVWGWSFAGNRRLCSEARADLAQAERLAASPRLDDRLHSLQVLQPRLEQLGGYRLEGRPLALGWGLYQGPALERALRQRYFATLQELMLAPVQRQLETLLARSVQPPPAPRPRPARPRPRPAPPAPQGTGSIVLVHFQPAGPASSPRPAARPAPRPHPDPEGERTYVALKTYLMLHDRSRMEAAHLADQLPRLWRPYLEAGGGRAVLPLAERTVAFYLSQLGEPDLPVIAVRPELVESVRRRLRAHARLLSPLEQCYQGLRARANTEFQPLTAARILHEQDQDLVAASCAVPGAFTRDAYSRLLQEAFREAAHGALGYDWVLAAARTPDARTDPADLQAQLEALYKADYHQAWQAFLQGLSVLGFGDAAGAVGALGRLGDPRQSPLKLILARAAHETSWDNPGEVAKALKNLRKGLRDKAGKVLGPAAPDAPGAAYGPLGQRFAALGTLALPGEGGGVALDGYLQVLHKLRTRMGAIAQAGDPYTAAREFLQATHLGAGSELAEASQFLETSVLSRADGPGRELLRPLLQRPLLQAYAALVPAAEQDLNRAWGLQVLGPWQALAGKYPFAESANEAPMGDIQKFLKPGEGILHQFVDKQLGPLVTLQGGRLTPRPWAGRSLGFSDAFLDGVTRLCRASVVLQEPGASRFELQPVPTPGLNEIILEVDGQKLHYRNGPQTWTAFAWPGPSGLQGARLQAVTAAGAGIQVQNAPGRLGLLRLLERARTEAPGGSGHTLEWPAAPEAGAARPVLDAPGAARIRFHYRMVSGPDPLRFNALRHHALPGKVTH